MRKLFLCGSALLLIGSALIGCVACAGDTSQGEEPVTALSTKVVTTAAVTTTVTTQTTTAETTTASTVPSTPGTPGQAAGGSLGETMTWSFDGTETLTLDGNGEMPDQTGETPWAANAGQITHLVIGNNITGIGANAFSGLTALCDVTIPRTVSTIGSEAFRDCTGLTALEIPDCLSRMGEGAFAGCTGLTKVVLPNTLNEIPARMFDGCTQLSEVTVPRTVHHIGANAFSKTALTAATIHKDCTVEDGAFPAGCAVTYFD